VAGIDEANARAELAAMQDRLARDPVSALGVTPGATPEEVRSAFLELTKRYHPVRFGRMAVDIQQLSNEVFLALRGAHDTLAKIRRRQTGPMPTARPTTAPPANQRILPPVPPRSTRPAGTSDSGERPAIGAPPITPSMGQPITPSGGSKTVPRPAAPQPAPRPAQGAVGPVRPTVAPPITPVAPSAAPREEAAVLDFLSRQQWDQARTALHQLAARDPTSKRLRALTSYARGRQAQVEGRVDDARVELHDALDLDPDLQLAKTALTELFTRRK